MEKWVVALTVVLLIPQTVQGQEQESTLFLDRAPTVQELIDALRPNVESTRGIQLESTIPAEGVTIEVVPVATDPLGVVENPPPGVTIKDVGLRVQFAFDSAELSPAARAELDTFAAAIVSDGLKDSLFVIAGHTDGIGTEPYNQRLSELRAHEARRYLVERHGIEPRRLSTVGFGESRLLPNLEDHAPEHRRVHFTTAWQGS